MKKKLFGLMLATALVIAPFTRGNMVVKATDNNCTTYTNYYFFSDIDSVSYYKNNKIGKTITNISNEFASIIPENAKFVSQGQVRLSRTYNTSMNTDTWDLLSFWKYYNEAHSNPNLYYNLGNTNYIGHSTWFFLGEDERKDSADLSGFSPSQLMAATILPASANASVNFGTVQTNPYGVTGQVKRTFTASGDDVGSTPISVNGVNSYVSPALYYVKYDVCSSNNATPVANTYKVNLHFQDESGKTIKDSEMGIVSNLADGEYYSVNAPYNVAFEGNTYTLVKLSDNSTGYIKGKDVDVVAVYKLGYYANNNDNNNGNNNNNNGNNTDGGKGNSYIPNTVANNPQTLDIPMILVISVGILSFGYAIYYLIKLVKKTNKIKTM